MLEKNLKLRENCYLIILSIRILKLEISGCDKKEDLELDLERRWKNLRRSCDLERKGSDLEHIGEQEHRDQCGGGRIDMVDPAMK
jgi:hypothetical protein